MPRNQTIQEIQEGYRKMAEVAGFKIESMSTNSRKGIKYVEVLITHKNGTSKLIFDRGLPHPAVHLDLELPTKAPYGGKSPAIIQLTREFVQSEFDKTFTQ